MTTPHPIERDEVMAYIDGELGGVAVDRVRVHLESCAECQALVRDLQQVSTRLQAWEVEAAPSRLDAAVRAALDEARDAADAPRHGRASWRAGWSGFRGWGLAAASLAAVALLAVIVVPSANRGRDGLGTTVAEPMADQGVASEELRALTPPAPEPTSEIARSGAAASPADSRAAADVDSAAATRAERPADFPTSRAVSPPATASVELPDPPARTARPVPQTSPPPSPPTELTRVVPPPVGQARQAAALNQMVAGRLDESMADAAGGEGYTVSVADFDQARLALTEVSEALMGRLDDVAVVGEAGSRELTAVLRVPVARAPEVESALQSIGAVERMAPSVRDEQEQEGAGRTASLLEKATVSDDGATVGVAVRLVVRNRPRLVRH